MNPSNRVTKKTTGIGTQIGMRWHEPTLKQIDAWRAKEPGRPSRTEAIRRLVEQALGFAAPRGVHSATGTAKASAMAREEMGRVPADKTAPAAEQERRKRRLLKGPKEFRQMRSDTGLSRGKS